MPFTTPLALLGLLFIPAVVAMYLLKLRRDETIVPSTLLWSRLVADVEANAPWQKLRRSLLLLLQLLLVAILALLAARPFLERPAGLARDVVLVLDTSASMAATDVTPDRLTAAKAAAIEALRDLPTGGKVSVIAADRSARIVVNETTDLGRVRQALDGIAVTQRPGRPGRRARAGRQARRALRRRADPRRHGRRAGHPDRRRRHGPGEGHGPAGRPGAEEPGDRGAGRADGAVRRHALGLRQRRQPRSRAGRAPARGVGRRRPDRGPRPAARPAGALRRGHRRRAARRRRRSSSGCVGPRSGRVTTAPDQLAVDDHAWAIVPPDRERLILVVGPGDPYLETALSYLPNVELFGVTPAEYGPATERQDGRPWDLVIFEGALPGDAAAHADPGHRARPPRASSARSPARSRTRASDRSTRPSRSCATSTCRRPTSRRRRS